MSFLSSKPSTPTPAAPVPRIGDAGQEASVVSERSKYKRRRGSGDTLLAGLGASTGASAGGTQRATLLGGTAS